MASEVQIVISAVDKTKGAISSASGSMGKFSKVALAGVATAAVAAAAAVATVGFAAFKLAKDAMPIKGVQDAFNGLNKAAQGGGDAMLDALKKGSAGMITNVDLMTSFNKAAQLVSIDFAQKLPDAMGYLGKVAAATGQDMGYMMDSLVTGVGRLSPMILDNLGIQVDLTAAQEDYALKIGKTVEELTKSEQQTALMDQVLMKLAENTASMPDIVGSATQQWASLGVQFANLKAEVGLALLPTLQKVMSWMSTVLMPFITDVVYPWIKENLPKAIKVLSDFWENTLKPAMEVVWAWMQGTLIPFLQNIVFPWLQEHIPRALQTLSNFWQTVLKPAIQAVWGWMSTVLMPFLQNVVFPWLQEHIPRAIQTLSDFWTNVLKPAIEVVWSFIETYLIPLLKVLNDIVGKVLVLAITALQGAWENVLLPALTVVWEFVQTYITPALTWLLDRVIKPLTTAIGTGLKNALNWIIEKLKAFKAALDSIKLPDWLTPGSPTPFELGIRGITDALSELNSMALPVFSAQMAGVGMSGNTTVNNFNLNANYGMRDRESLALDVKMLAALYG